MKISWCWRRIGGFRSPWRRGNIVPSWKNVRGERARLNSSGKPSVFCEREKIRPIEFTLTLDLKHWRMQKLTESAVDFLQGRMKDSPSTSWYEDGRFGKEAGLWDLQEVENSMEILTKFRRVLYQYIDMGVYQIIAMVNFGHLSCKPEGTTWKEPFPSAWKRDSEHLGWWPGRGWIFPFFQIERATVCFGFHAHFFRSNVINPCLGFKSITPATR